jgi:hypothetical protein
MADDKSSKRTRLAREAGMRIAAALGARALWSVIVELLKRAD